MYPMILGESLIKTLRVNQQQKTKKEEKKSNEFVPEKYTSKSWYESLQRTVSFLPLRESGAESSDSEVRERSRDPWTNMAETPRDFHCSLTFSPLV